MVLNLPYISELVTVWAAKSSSGAENRPGGAQKTKGYRVEPRHGLKRSAKTIVKPGF